MINRVGRFGKGALVLGAPVRKCDDVDLLPHISDQNQSDTKARALRNGTSAKTRFPTPQ